MKLESILKNASVAYNDTNHTYPRRSDGKLYVSCTSVTSMLPKDWLTKYGATEACKFLDANWQEGKAYSKEEKKLLLAMAKVEWEENNKRAQVIGTMIHDWIEHHVKGNDKPMPAGHERALEQFLEWEKREVKEWLASEIVVSSDEWEVAGRFDAVALLRGDITSIVDFKTSKQISPEYNIQTAGYWKCLSEMGFKADMRMILRIPKEATLKIYNKATRRVSIVENNLEPQTILSDLTSDLEIFKHLVAIYHWHKEND